MLLSNKIFVIGVQHIHPIRKNFVEILAHWAIGKIKSIKKLQGGVDHFNFLVTTSERKYVLTILRKEEKSYVQVSFKLLNKLCEKGLLVPVFKTTKKGKLFVQWKENPILLTQFLEGKHCSPPLSNNLLYEFGRSLALLDRTLQKFHFKWGKSWININADENSIKQLKNNNKSLHKELSVIFKLTKKSLLPIIKKCRSSLVHGDFHPWNVLVSGSKITGILDFYDLHSEYRLYDLAVAVAACCSKNKTIIQKSIKPLIKGYTSIIKLNNYEQVALYYFILYRCINVILFTWNELNDKHNIKAVSYKEYNELHLKWRGRANNWRKLGSDKFLELCNFSRKL